MEFKVYRTSNRWNDPKENKEISTLEELIEFMDASGELIIKRSYDDNNELHIEIYDDYRE